MISQQMIDILNTSRPTYSFDSFPFRRYALDLLLVYLAIASLLVAWANESTKPVATEPVAVVEPARGDLRWLSLHGIDDPYSERGQAMIRHRDSHRQQLEKILAKNAAEEEPSGNPGV